MKFLSLRKSLIGLDIQPNKIILLQLRKIAKNYVVEQAAIKEITSEIFLEEKIQDWNNLCFELSALVHELDLKNQRVAFSLPMHLIRMQHLQVLSGLNENEIRAEINAKVQQELIGIRDNLSIDYVEVGRRNEYLDILFAVTRQDYLTNYLQCIANAGLHAEIVDIDAYALQRAMCYGIFLRASNHQVHGLVRIYNNRTVFLVFNLNEIIFYQEWDFEQSNYIEELRCRLNIFQLKFPHLQIQRIYTSFGRNQIEFLHPDHSCLQDFTVFYSSPITQLKFNHSATENLVCKNEDDFLVPFGMAIREEIYAKH